MYSCECLPIFGVEGRYIASIFSDKIGVSKIVTSMP
jgi:hypothetical protein